LLQTESYTKPTDNRKPRNPVAKFYGRLHSTLTALQRIQEQLPREIFAPFVRAYSRHWLYSLDHGEKPSAPGNFYYEWTEAQQLGVIGCASADDLHAVRNYQIYESPRDRARQALGFDAPPAIGGEGRAAI